MPKTFRFELSVGFLGEAEQGAARELFDRVLAVRQSLGVDGERVLSEDTVESVLAAQVQFQLS